MSNNQLIEFMLDNKDFVTELKPYLGTSTRRNLGMTSKSMYDMMGGKSQADRDYLVLQDEKMKRNIDEMVDTLATTIPYAYFKDEKHFRETFQQKLLKLVDKLLKQGEIKQVEYIVDKYLNHISEMDVNIWFKRLFS